MGFWPPHSPHLTAGALSALLMAPSMWQVGLGLTSLLMWPSRWRNRISCMIKKTTVEKVKGLKDRRFSRDAIDTIGWRGKLRMANVKGDVAKKALVYDTEKDTWEDMSEGMLAGWKGPVAAMDEEVIYVVEELKGALKRYDPERDDWEDIMESERLIGAQQISAGGGRVCVVCGGSNSGGIVVLDVVTDPVRLWIVETPPGFEAVAVHILPRMSQPDLLFPVPP